MSYFLPLLAAIQMLFAGFFPKLTPENQDFIRDNIAGVWVIAQGEQGHPSYIRTHEGTAYAYVIGRTMYIGEDTWGQYGEAWNAYATCHEAGHASRYGTEQYYVHDRWLYEQSLKCYLEISREEQ